MPIDILMPALSPTMTSGTLANWIKNEGDIIKTGDVLAEIQTDKAIMELEATEEGILGKILISAGTQDVKVGELIAVLLEEGEAIDLDSYIQSKVSTKNVVSNNTIEVEKPESKNSISESSVVQTFVNSSSERIFASPLAKRIAQSEGIRLENIKSGTGPHGRIVKSDIEDFIAKAQNTNSFIGRAKEEFIIKPLSGMRKVIAQRLLESKQNIPHFYVSIDINVDNLNSIRAKLNQKLEQDNVKISINDLITKATAVALLNHPEIRTIWGSNELKVCNNIDISIAVSIENGLITPIVQNADQKSIVQISKEIKSLAKKAKEGSLAPNEYQGGCFTISNLGMFGVASFSGIINPPQSAILSVSAPQDRLILKDGNVFNTKVMNVSLSADHRVTDGADVAKFLNTLKDIIENPVLMFI